MLLLFGVVSAAAGFDLVQERIPNRLTYPAAAAGVLYWGLVGGWAGGLTGPGGAVELGGGALLALCAGLLPMLVVFALGGLGGGDVKLAAAIGAIAGEPGLALTILFYGVLVAMLLVVVLMVRRGLVRHPMPEDSPRIPLAVAMWGGLLLTGLAEGAARWTG